MSFTLFFFSSFVVLEYQFHIGTHISKCSILICREVWWEISIMLGHSEWFLGGGKICGDKEGLNSITVRINHEVVLE